MVRESESVESVSVFQRHQNHKSQSATFVLVEKGVSSAVVWTVRRWCLDCAAGSEREFNKRRPAAAKVLSP